MWRAGLGRSLGSLLSRPFVCECPTISTMPRFQSPPRRTQRADFPHCAPPFASRQRLWDLSCWGDFRPVASHSIGVKQPSSVVQPPPIPSFPAEALSFLSKSSLSKSSEPPGRLIKETLPNLTRVGILWNPDGAINPARLESMRDVTQPLGLKLVAVEARGLDALEQAFATMVREQMQAFILVSDTVLFNYRQQIGVMALKNRLPSTSSLKEFAEAGLLLSYGPDFQHLYSR